MIAKLILLPLVLGLAVSAVSHFSSRAMFQSVLIASGLVLVAILQLGMPPFPPISSKHKIIHLLLLNCVTAPMIPKTQTPTRLFGTAAIIATAFLWLNWRRFSVGMPLEPIVLSALTLAAVLAGVARADRVEDHPYLWPVALFVTMLATGLVGLLSGYLGLGQLALGFTAFLGGILLVLYTGMLVARPKHAFSVPAVFSWISLTTLGLLGTSLASFATNLHPFAYVLLLLTLMSPVVARRVPKMQSLMLPPIIFGTIAAVPAGSAVLVAFLHF
ncbi:hypothetical protein [Tritonibacter horizontis]|jgi:hypothetical protein|uniref:Uncharacterized protein n=1 Tax=Tritonibacter horizontis TaxID=1768241 RepID=A0A132C0U4_9RHOB|nr:hypothetical protein [Tritonibacter horizontis]KUP94204.1 hypothetical protein TRIHO_09400 [Tritonibacter horizontis]